MTHYRIASNIFHCCPPVHLPPQHLPPKKIMTVHELGIFLDVQFFSNLEYDYHVSLRNSLLNDDNLENDKPTIRKIQSYRFHVY